MNPQSPVELPDPRNADILVHVGGRLVPRAEAKVSVFDSSVQGGDAVWEGLRVYDGKVFRLDAHLDRLFRSARAMAFDEIPSAEEVKEALFATLRANGMRDGAHVRLTLTRGEKTTSGMSPTFNRYGLSDTRSVLRVVTNGPNRPRNALPDRTATARSLTSDAKRFSTLRFTRARP